MTASVRLGGICLKAVKTLALIILIKWLVIVGNILEGVCVVDRGTQLGIMRRH